MATRRLDDFNHGLQRAVFLANYRSTGQRALRYVAIVLIATKHGIRGLLYVWPLVLLLFVDFSGAWVLLQLTLVIAAVAAWFRFIYASVRDDYGRHVRDRLIDVAALWRML
jgi:hypothetical protein